MDKTKRNVVALGVLTVVAVAAFFWGLYFLLGSPVLRGGMDVVVALENAGGLKRGDRVMLQGVEVGSVSSIRLDEPAVHANVHLNDDYPLPADTRATVRSSVFGANTVELLPGQALVKLEEGDTIRGVNAPALAEAAVDLSASARTLLLRADTLLSAQAIADLHATAAVLPSSAEQLRAAFAELRLAAAALRRTTEGLEEAQSGPALTSAIRGIDESARAVGALAETMQTSLGSMASVMTKVDQGRGTLGRLVNDTSLYANLNGAARELRTLTADIKANPRRYLTIQVF